MIGESILYGTSVAVMGNALHFMVFEKDVPSNRQFGGQFQFLTNIGLVLAFAAHCLGLAGALSGSATLKRVKNELNFVSIPLEVLISCLYWSICAYDRALVVPPEMAVLLPFWLDLSIHAFPSVAGLAEVFTFAPRWSKTYAQELPAFATFAAVYYVWIQACKAQNGVFPYPLLELFAPLQMVLFFGFLVLLTTSFYSVLAAVQRPFK